MTTWHWINVGGYWFAVPEERQAIYGTYVTPTPFISLDPEPSEPS